MCDQRERLLDFLYDEVTPEGRRAMERHLEACGECCDEVRAFRKVREDLLAWGVPNPPSVWTAFAPVAAVPWHRQIPAWALAAAATLIIAVGGAGGFFAHSVLDGSGRGSDQVASASPIPAEVVQASAFDAEAIMALIKKELAGASEALTPRATLIANSPARYQLDAKTEERLLSRVTELVNARDQQQRMAIGEYLNLVRQEDEIIRRDNTVTINRLGAQMEQLQAQVAQLVLAQAKGQ